MNFKKIYYEPKSLEYPLGQALKEKYKKIEWIPIESHNNIEELRNRSNKDFVEMKKYLIIGTRKTHKYVNNHKSSDFLVPFTSSGCRAMCLYCYLVCNYNKCSYLRVYTNIEEILTKLIQTSQKTEKESTFEIGSNSDLILENQVTENLPKVIETFAEKGRGFITFPTKFSMVESLLPLNHQGKTIIRMSLNPQYLISQVEIGTSSLKNRIDALKKLYKAGYKIGILIAPIILVDQYKELYTELLQLLSKELSPAMKKDLFIEVIFMTYSYIHRAINDQAFPQSLQLYNKEKMIGRGRGKYMYKKEDRIEAEVFLRKQIKKYLKESPIIYIV